MSTSRIEVPLTPPEPHFDDDATVATARRVVPLKGARRRERRRKVMTLAPLLLASTLCGALGALAVNYYEKRNAPAASSGQETALPTASESAKTGASPQLTATPAEQTTSELQGRTNSADVDTVNPKDIVKTDAPKVAESAEIEPIKHPRETVSDAAKLVRKRRVHPPDAEAALPKSRRNGAGRIEDLFGGPNP